jgi:hypothetical protein
MNALTIAAMMPTSFSQKSSLSTPASGMHDGNPSVPMPAPGGEREDVTPDAPERMARRPLSNFIAAAAEPLYPGHPSNYRIGAPPVTAMVAPEI